jgi:hypothetical protein
MEEDDFPLKEDIIINYTLSEGDVVLVQNWGYGFVEQDIGKYVEVVSFQPNHYLGQGAVTFKAYDSVLETTLGGGAYAGMESFGKVPMILLNINDEFEAPAPTEELVEILKEDSYCLEHYNLYYTLTEKDIEAGKIKVDAYWVAKQWKTGSRDDSGALWHSLKTIARFGEKNSKEREIKALYNQALALARIYNVDLKDE